MIVSRALNNELTTIMSLVLKAGLTALEREVVELKYFHRWLARADKFHRLKLVMNKDDAFQNLKKLLKEAKYNLSELPEGEERFLLEYNLSPTQWLLLAETKQASFGNLGGRRAIELVVEAKDLSTPDQAPAIIPRALVASFDIETFSSLYKTGRFPESERDKDIICCLSYVLGRSDKAEALKKTCIVVSPEHPLLRLEGIELIVVEDEDELLKAFASLVNRTDPDVIIGYNTFGYDFKYICARAERYDGLPCMGRLCSGSTGLASGVSESMVQSKTEKFTHKEWTGAGNTFHEYHYPQAHGRVLLDVYMVAQKLSLDYIGHNRKGIDAGPKSHKLDDMGEFYCGDTKHAVDYKQQFAFYDEAMRVLNALDDEQASVDNERVQQAVAGLNALCAYCVQDSFLCLKLFHALKVWVGTRESASIMFQDMNKVLVTGMTQKYKAQLIRETRKQGYYLMPPKQTSCFKLKGGHVEPPVKGLNKDVVVVDFAGMYPSIMRRYNICPTAVVLGNLNGIEPVFHAEFERVVVPIETGLHDLPAFYEVPVGITPDKFLAQPGSKEAVGYNAEYVLGLMLEHEYDPKLLDSFVNLICDHLKLPRFHKGREENLVLYINQKRKGVNPTILERLSDQRQEFKKLMKRATEVMNDPNASKEDKEQASVNYIIYDQRQNAIKVLMNSFYGIYGTQNGDYRLYSRFATSFSAGELASSTATPTALSSASANSPSMPA